MIRGRSTEPPAEVSLLDILSARATADPERIIFTFLEDGEVETERLTYGQLDRRAKAIAAHLQSQSVQPGDRVLLVYPPGLEFIAALFGCFYAGAGAVPVAPPRLAFAVDPLRPLLNMVRDCEPAAVLTDATLMQSLLLSAGIPAELTDVALIESASLSDALASQFKPVPVTRRTLALLQYTSGSTGHPRGVMVSHGNLLSNLHVIQVACQHRTALRMGGGVCWLPFYHDMGLIGNVLQAVYVDGPCCLMSPIALLQHPIRWLQAIMKHKAHTSGGPNFAFDLCVRRITSEQKRTLDLSCWEMAPIGAEPVSAAVMERFSSAFAECGFRKEAFFPCYGLAEATLFMTGGDKEDPPVVRTFPVSQLEYHASDAVAASPDDRTQTVVGCGHAWTDHEVLIVDPVTRRRCDDGVVGEIWARGSSIAQGYWGRAAETEATFHASLADGTAGDFLRTGDLGMITDGELFVCGRLKDLIVIRGHNHYPQDLEETVVAQHDAFKPNSAAAIGCFIDGEEQLVILQEIDRASRKLDAEALRREIRRAIAEQHQVQVFDVVLLANGALPKTTSGKVRRGEARDRYLAGRLPQWSGGSSHE